jgi:hypothetical protein
VPAWATVVLTIFVGLLGVAGTLAATLLQQRHGTSERRERERQEVLARLAVAAGRLRSLLSDADPDRVGINVGEHSRDLLREFDARWQPLRDDLFALGVLLGARESDEIVARLVTATGNLLNRDGWLVNDLLTHRASMQEAISEAREEHVLATTTLHELLAHVQGDRGGNNGATEGSETGREPEDA